MRKKNANAILRDMIDYIILSLNEISDAYDAPHLQFIYGEKIAYVECLELLAHWSKAKKYGLDFNIEERFPL